MLSMFASGTESGNGPGVAAELDSISNVLTSLFKIAMLVRKAVSRDRYAKAAASKEAPMNDMFDIAHVEHKYPKAKASDWLIARLGKAITKRRQYLRYCQTHQEKLGRGSRPAPQLGNLLDTSSRKRRLPDQMSRAGTLAAQSSHNSRPTLAPTSASTLAPIELFQVVNVSDDEKSQTSFATTLSNSQDGHKLSVPRLADIGSATAPFECPYCHTIQRFRTQRAWRYVEVSAYMHYDVEQCIVARLSSTALNCRDVTRTALLTCFIRPGNMYWLISGHTYAPLSPAVCSFSKLAKHGLPTNSRSIGDHGLANCVNRGNLIIREACSFTPGRSMVTRSQRLSWAFLLMPALSPPRTSQQQAVSFVIGTLPSEQ